MPLTLPTNQEVIERIKTDIQRENPALNPFLKNSAVGAIATAHANRVHDTYLQLDVLQNIVMPDTADTVFLERWAAIYGKTRLPATKSIGNITFTGTLGTSIPAATTLVHSDGQTYSTQATVAINTFILTITSLTRSGSIVTAVTSTPHNYSNLVKPTISGATQTEYNVSNTDIIIVDEFTFTYEITGTPVTPATGTITSSANYGPAIAESDNFQDSENGVNVNLPTGDELTLQSPIVNIDNDAGVGAGGIDGGVDQESDSSLRNRTVRRIQNPVAHFNVSDITEQAETIAGVTRVFVFEVTPATGQVTIYFMRDNDLNPIPSGPQVTEVKNAILTIKPANTSDVDVIVSAPTAVPTTFTFTAISPNTPTMQAAVEANLQQFFSEETSVGVNVEEDAYRAAIQNTIDTTNGDRVTSFTLSSPVGDIVIATGQIATLSTVTFP